MPRSNAISTAIFSSTEFAPTAEYWTELFGGSDKTSITKLYILAGIESNLKTDLEVEAITAESEIDFVRQVAQKATGDFSLDRYLDEILTNYQAGKMTDEDFKAAKEKIRSELPVLVYYPDLPPLILPSATEKLITGHIQYIADCSFYDNESFGLTPILIAPWTIAKMPAPAESTRLRAHILKNLSKLDVELSYARPDISYMRPNWFVTDDISLQAAAKLVAFVKKENLTSYETLADKVATTGWGIRTTPKYFEIEISNECELKCSFCPRQFTDNPRGFMSLELFNNLADQIGAIATSDKSICLGGLGEPLEHPEFTSIIDRLAELELINVFIETNGLHLTPEIAQLLADKLGSNLTLITNLGTTKQDRYAKLYGADRLTEVKTNLSAAKTIWHNANLDPKNFIVQQLKIADVDDEVEEFFDYVENELKATPLLQKYNSYRGKMPELRPTDMTPLERNFCWHLARDMYIQADGFITFCKQDIFTGNEGHNLADTPLLEAWSERGLDFADNFKGRLNETQECAGCDEWYTFNA